MTVNELCELYIAEGMTTLKASTARLTRGVLRNYVKPLLGRRDVADLTRSDVEQLLARVAEGRLPRRRAAARRQAVGGRGAAKNAVIGLSAALAFAVRRGLRPNNPAFGIRKPASRNAGRRLTSEEMARLGVALAAAEASGRVNPYRLAAIRLLSLTGCRRGEVLGLKWAYVDRRHQCLRLPDSKTGQKTVYVGRAALAVLDSLPKVAGNPHVLPGQGSGHVSCVQAVWSEIRAAAGLPDLRLHDLRHAFATRAIVGGESLRVVGALLGHRRAASTAYYAHPGEESVKGAADLISGEIANALQAPGRKCSTPEQETQAIAAIPGLSALLGRSVVSRGLDAEAAAARWGFTPEMLLTWRTKGVGPPFRSERDHIVYDAAELDAWGAALRAAWTPAALRAMRIAEAGA